MTQDDVIRLAKKAGISVKDPQFGWSEEHHIAGWITELEAFAKLVAEHEREACAKVCYELMLKDNPYDQWRGQNLCMEAIRARNKQ